MKRRMTKIGNVYRVWYEDPETLDHDGNPMIVCGPLDYDAAYDPRQSVIEPDRLYAAYVQSQATEPVAGLDGETV